MERKSFGGYLAIRLGNRDFDYPAEIDPLLRQMTGSELLHSYDISPQFFAMNESSVESGLMLDKEYQSFRGAEEITSGLFQTNPAEIAVAFLFWYQQVLRIAVRSLAQISMELHHVKESCRYYRTLLALNGQIERLEHASVPLIRVTTEPAA
jgi:hypothetical protein